MTCSLPSELIEFSEMTFLMKSPPTTESVYWYIRRQLRQLLAQPSLAPCVAFIIMIKTTTTIAIVKSHLQKSF